MVGADRCFLRKSLVLMNLFTLLPTTYPDKTSLAFRQTAHHRKMWSRNCFYICVTHTPGNNCVLIRAFLYVEVISTFTAVVFVF